MASINSVVISGRATRDPEGKEIGNDNFVANLGLASDRSIKVGDSYESVPNFFDVAVFGNYGKLIEKKLRKGDLITVQGELRYESWEAEDGSKRSKVSIIAKTVEGEFQFRKADGSDTPAKSEGAAQTSLPVESGTEKSDIPF